VVMKKISILLTQRGSPEKLNAFMDELVSLTTETGSVEMVIAVDDNDDELLTAYPGIVKSHESILTRVFIVKQSEHFTKDYWNFLAKQAQGRFILTVACDNKMFPQGWDEIIWKKMDAASKAFGDDFVCGLTKDNIRRTGENPVYPIFSCHPVLSKTHVDVLGYFYDERYWSWGSDQAVALLYRRLGKLLGQMRLVSIMDVLIYDYNSVHTTTETDPDKLEQMRQADRGYQKHLRISQEHPCDLKIEDYEFEALKIINYLKGSK